MKPIELAVRCTREEYMDYAVHNGKKHWWTVPIGLLPAAMSIAFCVVMQRIDTASLLWGVVGLVLLILDPLILPLYRKGEAAKLYDRSDSLQGAITLRLEDSELSMRSATTEATLKLDAMTEVKLTPRVIGLCFGETLTVCIPKRVLQEEELEALMTSLAQILKKEPDV